jgi:hypothetical protein
MHWIQWSRSAGAQGKNGHSHTDQQGTNHTMPRSVCTALGLKPGAKVDFIAEGEGFKAMNDAIGDAATARHRQSGR